MALPDLPGYERIRGDSARRVRTPSGETISRREYENRRFRRGGYASWREFQTQRDTSSYRRFIARAVKETKEPRSALRSAGSDFNLLYLTALREGMGDETPGEIKQAFRDLLVYLGWRKESDPWNIGDTPKRNERK
jgi:hypothetical protein